MDVRHAYLARALTCPSILSGDFRDVYRGYRRAWRLCAAVEAAPYSTDLLDHGVAVDTFQGRQDELLVLPVLVVTTSCLGDIRHNCRMGRNILFRRHCSHMDMKGDMRSRMESEEESAGFHVDLVDAPPHSSVSVVL
jgi:hypothetical protein